MKSMDSTLSVRINLIYHYSNVAGLILREKFPILPTVLFLPQQLIPITIKGYLIVGFLVCRTCTFQEIKVSCHFLTPTSLRIQNNQATRKVIKGYVPYLIYSHAQHVQLHFQERISCTYFHSQQPKDLQFAMRRSSNCSYFITLIK